MIVADTGPLIALIQLGRLDLLQRIAGTVNIPAAVYEELVIQSGTRGQAETVERSPWIQRRAVTNQEALSMFPSQLHRGEREAIVLAQELKTQLLIDERRGRKSAQERGVKVFGTLRVLAEAKRLGLIPAAKPLVDSLRATGYWIDEKLVSLFLREVGEADS
jgi:hypothetical protein